MVVSLRWLARLVLLIGLIWLLRGWSGSPAPLPATPTPLAQAVVRLRARLANPPSPGSQLVFHFPEAALDLELPCERLTRQGDVFEAELTVPVSASRFAVTLRSPQRQPVVSALTELSAPAELPIAPVRRVVRPRVALPAPEPLRSPTGPPVLVKASLNDMIGPPP